jgi:hypothetical protein
MNDQNQPNDDQLRAMGVLSTQAISAIEATNKATADSLRPIIGALRDAMTKEDKAKALRAVAKSLAAIHQTGRADAISIAANRIERDPLDFDAVRIVKLAIDAMSESVEMLSSWSNSTGTTPGAFIPPTPPSTPEEYRARSIQRDMNDWADFQRRKDASMSPIEALAARNGMR